MPPGVQQVLGVPIGPAAEHAARNSPFARYLSEAQRPQKNRDEGLMKFTTGINHQSERVVKSCSEPE
jgi:hypothetical protein